MGQFRFFHRAPAAPPASPPKPAVAQAGHGRGWLTIVLIVVGLLVLTALGQMFGR